MAAADWAGGCADSELGIARAAVPKAAVCRKRRRVTVELGMECMLNDLLCADMFPFFQLRRLGAGY